MHHDFGAGDHHASNIDGHAGEHSQWVEQKRERHARHQSDDRGKWDRDPQDAHVPAVAHGGTEGPLAIGAAESRKAARRSLVGHSGQRVHPRAPSACPENQAAPLAIVAPFWRPILAPKYGLGAAWPVESRRSRPGRKSSYI
jgi:hypothetical protein